MWLVIAWRPVRLKDGRWAWLQIVERAVTGRVFYGDRKTLYREIGGKE